MIGSTILHYKIIQKLGEGGMGVVYLAEDTRLERKVAIKFLPRHIAANKEDRQRFEIEAKAAAGLNHPNIATIYAIEEADEEIFIVMEYIDGEELKEQVAGGRWQVAEIIDIASQIAEGLEAAHEKGIVHRDIKSSNIMITEKGQVKIMDFGLAKMAGGAQLTKDQSTLGTAAYMSPEQARGENVDHRTDIWSFGVILYEMLTGRMPFKGDYEQAVLYSILNEEPLSIANHRDDIPIELTAVVDKTLEKEVQNRYQAIGQLVADLKRLNSRPESQKNGQPAVSPAGKKIPRAGILKFVIALLLISVMVGGYIFYVDQSPALNPNLVAVNIFENQTGESDLDPLARLAAERIAEGISRLETVEIISISTILQLPAETRSEPGKLAKETLAGIVVSGTYYLTGDTLRFQAEITDAVNKKLLSALPSESGFREAATDIVTMLRQRIMTKLGMHYDVYSGIEQSETPLYAAYKEYVIGTEFFGSDYAQAIHHYQRALEIDSTFIAPLLRIAVSYGNQGQYAQADSILKIIHRKRELLTLKGRYYLNWYTASLHNKHEEALKFMQKVEKIDPQSLTVNYLIGNEALALNRPQLTIDAYRQQNAEAWYTRRVGVWRLNNLTKAYHLLGEHRQELAEAQRGRNYYPELQTTCTIEARALAALGKIKELHGVIEKSLGMPSVDGYNAGKVMTDATKELAVHGHRQHSLDMANQAVEWYKKQPDNTINRYALAEALYLAKRWQEAQILFEALSGEDSANIDYWGYLGVLAVRLGDSEKAEQISRKLEAPDRAYLFGKHTYWLSCIAALQGKKELAMTYLREASARGRSYGIWLHQDKNFEPLRDYEPFQECIRPKN